MSLSLACLIDCLSTETLLFLWDQYFITSDVPDFAEELLSSAAAATMIILRDYIFSCREVNAMLAFKPY